MKQPLRARLRSLAVAIAATALASCAPQPASSFIDAQAEKASIRRVVADMERQQERLGPDFALSKLLRSKAEAGEKLAR